MTKLTVKAALVAVALSGVSLSGCDQSKDDGAGEAGEAVEAAQSAEAAPEEEAPEAEEEPAEEEVKVDRDNYIEAAYQVGCVEKVLEGVDKRKEMKTEILARFGFDEESFSAASGQLGGDEMIKTAVSTRLEKCTVEIAEGFGGAEDAEETGEQEEQAEEKAAQQEQVDSKKKAAPKKPTPVATGTFRGEMKGGVERGALTLRVKDDFTVSGKAQIRAEGNTANISLSGKVSEDKKSFTAQGTSGQTSVELSGTIRASSMMGKASGKAYGKDFNSRFSLKK